MVFWSLVRSDCALVHSLLLCFFLSTRGSSNIESPFILKCLWSFESSLYKCIPQIAYPWGIVIQSQH